MPRVPQTKTIIDADGAAHSYEVTPHGGRDGLDLLAKIIGRFTGSPGEGGVKGVASSLAGSSGAWDLAMDVLRFTKRDGFGAAAKADEAYQANYGELALALEFALAVNFGGLLETNGPFLEAVRGWVAKGIALTKTVVPGAST